MKGDAHQHHQVAATHLSPGMREAGMLKDPFKVLFLPL